METRWTSDLLVPPAAELASCLFAAPPGGAMLASRVARGPWGALRGAIRVPGARLGKGHPREALLPPNFGCLGCASERWWLRPVALGPRLSGTSPRDHSTGAGKATPGPAAAAAAAAEARARPWGPSSAASLVG